MLEGQCIGIYINLPKNILKPLREATLSTKYVETYRTRKALPTKSSVFGALPRIPMRNDFCRFSNKTFEEKENMKKLMSFQKIFCAKFIKNIYQAFLKKILSL
jgi:hypothetical protein